MKQKNVVNWFEIPVVDMERAQKFYEQLLEVKLQAYPTPRLEMVMFPYVFEGQHAGGCLVKDEMKKPSLNGTLVYFTCENIDNILAKVESIGGRIITPKTEIGENGIIAHIKDSEGNMIGLHSSK